MGAIQAEVRTTKLKPAKGKTRFCWFFNSSIGCSNPQCKFDHRCPKCGAEHCMIANH
jgi:hypothetical protein